jgi:hypothetical protein
MSIAPTPERLDVELRAAQERGYRYPPSFGGFAATVRVVSGSRTTSTNANVVVDGEGVVVTLNTDDEASRWAGDELRSIVAHRRARDYDQVDGRFEKRVVADDNPLGHLIEIDDPMGSSYRLADGQITLVTRRPGGRRFSIVVQERSAVTVGAEVPTAFTVFYWDVDEALVASEAYTDRYVDVDGLFLPGSRTIVRADAEGIATRRLVLSDHVLRWVGDAR